MSGFMKKVFVWIFFTIICLCNTVTAIELEQYSEQLNQNDSLLKSRFEKFSHWSVGINGGMTFLDGDIRQQKGELHTFFNSPKLLWNIGAYGEYSINPLIGVGLEYRYMQMGQRNVTMASNGDMHEVSPYVSVCLNNVFGNPHVTYRWKLNFKIGMGLGYYNITTESVNGEILENVKYGDSDGLALLLPIGLNFEYNITKDWALGLYYNYRYSLGTDLLDGRSTGTSNDGIHELALGVRYKINARKRPHNYNINQGVYQLDELKGHLAALKDEGGLDNTKPYQKDTLYVIEQHKDTVYIVQEEENVLKTQETTSIYFATGQSVLTPTSLVKIATIAELMITNEDLTIQIQPYFDEAGTYEYNLSLGKERAERIVKELYDVWGISDKRVKINEAIMMQSKDGRKHYQPFRKCVITIVK